jgi:predicted Zn-dependent peptidase
VPEDELERTKELRSGRLLMGLEDSRSVASWVGSQEMTYREIRTPEEVMERIQAVTREDVQELADELFQTDKLSLALIGPYSDEAAFRSILTL